MTQAICKLEFAESLAKTLPLQMETYLTGSLATVLAIARTVTNRVRERGDQKRTAS